MPCKIDGEVKGIKIRPDRRGAAAPGRQSGAVRRPGLDRRTGPRHAGRRHRQPGERAGRQGVAGPGLQPAGRPDRRPRAGAMPRSAGRSIASRPSFESLSPKTEQFETGIKVIDLLTPFVRGGKIGLFGGAGLGKTVILTGADRPHRDGAQRLLGLRRRRRAHPRGERPLAGNAGSQDRQHGQVGHRQHGHGASAR